MLLACRQLPVRPAATVGCPYPVLPGVLPAGKTIGQLISTPDAPSSPAIQTPAYAAAQLAAADRAGAKRTGFGGGLKTLLSAGSSGKSAAVPADSDLAVTMSPVCCDVITLLCHGINDKRSMMSEVGVGDPCKHLAQRPPPPCTISVPYSRGPPPLPPPSPAFLVADDGCVVRSSFLPC